MLQTYSLFFERSLMATEQVVQEFSALVCAGQFIAAIERFYASRIAIRENLDPPRLGREAALLRERQTLARFSTVTAERIGPVLVNGSNVAIHWRFEFTTAEGERRVLDEVAWQVWEGDQIIAEQFFYDVRQLSNVLEPRQ
jgi:hypothetical protein